ncbi:MAG TPA: hemerythrin family protein [Rhodospirillaceae bacterium]|nr:hemerythrin family protein [Rhodospirillaceae bacterium]
MVTFITWGSEMSVGSELLDGHHRMIIDCLNQLHPLLDGNGNEAQLAKVLTQLEEFVLLHFSEEEQAMRHAGYPDWRAHKDQHDRMYDVVFNLKADAEHGRALDARHLFDLVYNWLLDHILGTDKQYQPFLAAPHPEADDSWHRSNGRPY